MHECGGFDIVWARVHVTYLRKTMVQKLTRQQIKDGLDQIPVEILLSSGKGKKPALTKKQSEFARQLVLAPSKAEAYRRSYNTKGTAVTQGNNASRLSRDTRIKAEAEAYRLALEAEKHRNPAQLKALLVQQLVQHSLDEEFPPAQRVQCLKLLGSLFEVQAFTEHKTVERVDNKSGDIKARLLKVLGQHAVDVEAKAVHHDDDADSLLAELVSTDTQDEQPTPVESQPADPDPTGAPPFGPSARGSDTHTIPHIQPEEKNEAGPDASDPSE